MSTMQFQFNTDSSVMGTQDVAARIEAQVRRRLERVFGKAARHAHDPSPDKQF